MSNLAHLQSNAPSRLKQALTAILTIISCTLILTPNASAHGGGGIRRLSYEPIGLNYLHVWTSPAVARVGRVHIEALVTDADYQIVVAQRVIIEVTPLQGGEAMRAIAGSNAAETGGLFASLRSSDRQGADFMIEQPGGYQVEVTVLGVDGQGGRTSFEMQVSEANSWLLVARQGMLPILALVGSWLLVEGIARVSRFYRRG